MNPPSFIAHYRLADKLGEGAMGAVYRATDTKLKRQVAIKILPDSFGSDPERMSRFAREAYVLASLNHPNIAAIYGVEARALVMELVEGATLAERIPMSAANAMPLVHQLIDALEYAHERGVIHRDLKPANIKVTGSGSASPGTLKLLDFGLARKIESGATGGAGESLTSTATQTIAGQLMGTARYMSPEQARGAKVDHRTDIWAFGAVLFEMLTGQPAFSGSTVSDTIAAVLRSDPDFGAVPEPFRRLVERCLQRDLKQRLGWIGDARLLLEAPATQPGRPVRRPAVIAVLTAASLLSGFAVSRWLLPANHPGGVPAARIARVTSDAVGFLPAISPDGKMAAYLARRTGSHTVDLWVQQVSGGAAIRLTDGGLPHRIFSSPAFAADGSKLFYYSDVGAPGIYEVPVLGGESRLAIPGAGIYRVCPSPDGKWLAYVLRGKLMVRPPNGGDGREIAPTRKVLPLFLAWSPDSSSILAAIENSERKPLDLVVAHLDGSSPRPAPGLYGNLERRGFGDLNIMRLVAWLPEDQIVFTARYGDATNLWRIPLAGMGEDQPSPVTLAPWSNGGADIRGNHLVFANERSTNQVWSLAADLNQGRVLGELELVTPELLDAQFPDVRADGSAMTYISRRAGGQGVTVVDLKNGQERNLLVGQRNAAYSTFSPDGSQIAFGTGGRGWPAFLVRARGGEVTPVGESGGRIRGWSRDGRYLLIWRVPQGRNTIGVLDLTTGSAAETLRSDAGGLSAPRFSPDSRWVAFHSPDAPRSPLWIAPFRGSAAVPAAEWISIAEGAGSPFWAPDGRSLYFVRMQDGSPYATRLFRQPIDPAAGRPVGQATEFYRLDGYSFTQPLLNTISATRDHVYLLLGGGTSDVWTMELPD